MFRALSPFRPPPLHLLCSFVKFSELFACFSISFSAGEKKKKKSCLQFLNSSSTPGPNPHLKWLSKELKVPQRSHARLLRLTATQQPRGLFSFSKEKWEKIVLDAVPLKNSHHASVFAEFFTKFFSEFYLTTKKNSKCCCPCYSFKDLYVWNTWGSPVCSTSGPTTKLFIAPLFSSLHLIPLPRSISARRQHPVSHLC